VEDLEKASVSHLGQKILLTGSSPCARNNKNRDFSQKQRSTEFFQQWGTTVHLQGSQAALLDALTHGHGYAVSHGSYKDDRGSVAWIIEGPDSSLRLVGKTYTPGHPGNHSSFRSEVAGIVGVLHTLTFWVPHLAKPPFRLACDGLSVVHRLNNQKPIEPTEPHADLLLAAHNLILESAYNIHLVFVKGHQDTGFPTVLTQDAWLNVEVDLLAKTKLAEPHAGPDRYRLPGNPWSCYTGTTRVVTQLVTTLRNHINGQETLSYWENRRKLAQRELQQVDWPSFGRAMREVPTSKRRWVTKQVSNHFAHGKNMVRWKQRSKAACPRCAVEVEDKEHIIRCPHPEAISLWHSALSSLEWWLKETDTDPTITMTLIAGLKAWYQNEDFPPQNPATTQQSLLGWNGVLDGWLGTEWCLQQEAFWSQWK